MLRATTSTMRDAAVSVARFMLEEVDKNISSGANMKPLATKYGKWKAKYFPGKPILVLTAQLRKSLKPVAVEMT